MVYSLAEYGKIWLFFFVTQVGQRWGARSEDGSGADSANLHGTMRFFGAIGQLF